MITIKEIAQSILPWGEDLPWPSQTSFGRS